jgi:hypothetical protein
VKTRPYLYLPLVPGLSSFRQMEATFFLRVALQSGWSTPKAKVLRRLRAAPPPGCRSRRNRPRKQLDMADCQ